MNLKSKIILYFFGGGDSDNVSSHRSIIANLVNVAGFPALIFDYHPTPEFSAPAAVNESAAFYRRMLDQGYQPEDIIFVGDSEGGGIEIVTLLKLKENNIPMPAACVAFSPCLGDPDHSFVSTPSGDLAGLPPIMIHVGNDEVMRKDLTCFAERADAAGVDIHVKIWKGMVSCFPLVAMMSDEATEAMKQVTEFIRRKLHKDDREFTAAFLDMILFSPF